MRIDAGLAAKQERELGLPESRTPVTAFRDEIAHAARGLHQLRTLAGTFPDDIAQTARNLHQALLLLQHVQRQRAVARWRGQSDSEARREGLRSAARTREALP